MDQDSNARSEEPAEEPQANTATDGGAVVASDPDPPLPPDVSKTGASVQAGDPTETGEEQ